MKKILFITSTCIGDAAMSTVALNYIVEQNPDAEVTVACGPVVAEMFTQFPTVHKVIPIKKEKHHKHWLTLWKHIYKTRWDVVIDLRNTVVSRLVRANKRYIFSKPDTSTHKLDQLAKLVGADTELATKLYLKDETIERARKLIPENSPPVLAIGPTANWIGKIWEAEKFAELIKRLTAEGEIFYNAKIAIIAGPGEEDIANKVLNSIPPNRRINVIANTPIEVSLAVIKLSTLYIGHDSGLTHCASALGTPNLSLFGVTKADQFHPRGEHSMFVTIPEDEYEITNHPDYDHRKVTETMMKNLTVDTVYDATIKLYNKAVAG